MQSHEYSRDRYYEWVDRIDNPFAHLAAVVFMALAAMTGPAVLAFAIYGLVQLVSVL